MHSSPSRDLAVILLVNCRYRNHDWHHSHRHLTIDVSKTTDEHGEVFVQIDLTFALERTLNSMILRGFLLEKMYDKYQLYFAASSRSTSPLRRMPSLTRERSEDYMKRVSPMKTRIPTPRYVELSYVASYIPNCLS